MNRDRIRTGAANLRVNAAGAALALLLAGGVLMVIQGLSFRREAMADALAHARVIASSSAAAVMFNDADAAAGTLDSLRTMESVQHARIEDSNGQSVATFIRRGGDATRTSCSFDCPTVSTPILLRDQQVGTVRLQIDMSRMHARLLALGGAFLVASLVAYALTLPLMRRMRARVRNAESKLEYLAHFDPVTGLRNRNAFNAYLATDRQRGSRHALLQLDLDRFKEVNDTLGHHGGDELLLQVGARITETVSDRDRVFRLGGDEFAVALADVAGADDAQRIAQAILNRLEAPFRIGSRSVNVTGSVGISLWPDDAAALPDLAANADIAMYCAKRNGRNRAALFEPALRDAQKTRLQLQDALRIAIANGELELHYQPQVHTRDGRLLGAEALLRWTHPELGRVGPATFIPIAEDSGLIIELGRWVISEACRQIARWHAQGLGLVRVAVNLSVRQTRDEGLPGFIDDTLRTTGVPAHCLELEVTESVLMEDADLAIAQLARLRARGLHLAIDDFGTGYSSMAYLKRLPIHKLKIDMTFVQAIPGDGEAIATAILAMAHTLGLVVVAEGVETEEQQAFFQQGRCEQLQGYLIGHGLPADAFASRWLGRAVELRLA